MGLSHGYGIPPSPKDGSRLLNRALDLGVTLLDTAALYGAGQNEVLLGNSVMHRRNEFVLASKCGFQIENGIRVLDGSPAAISATLDTALLSLKTDCIDLYYLHRVDPSVPIEDSIGALARAVEAGKIRMIGLSEVSASTIERAHSVHPVSAIQNEYSPIVRNPEVAVIDTCLRLGIALVAFSPVARGLLAGSVTDDSYVHGDIRSSMPRFVAPQLKHNLEAVAAFNGLARSLGYTPAQLALGWALSSGPHVVPIPGTTSIAHLEENIAAATITLTHEVMAQIEAIFSAGSIRGPRYSPAMQALSDTEILPDEEIA
jgi:hypothetical protein